MHNQTIIVKNRPSLQSLLLFSLLTSSKIPEENEFFTARTVPFVSYTQLSWRFFDYKPSSLRSAVSSLRDQGMVVSVQKQGQTQIRSTELGREYLLSQFPAGKHRQRKWDESWRVVIFSGARQQHTQVVSRSYRIIRQKLAEHGFAQLERGVYLSPHPFPEDLRKKMLQDKQLQFLTVFETTRFIIGDERAFANQAWDLRTLSKQYAKLSIAQAKLLPILEQSKRLKDAEKTKFVHLSRDLYSLLTIDPALPSKLLPIGFESAQSLQLFFQICAEVSTLSSGT